MKTQSSVKKKEAKGFETKWVREKLEKRNWSIADGMNLSHFPKWLRQTVYSKNDMVWFKGRFMKGRVAYDYIPAPYTKDNVPIIIETRMELNTIFPEDAQFLSFNELKQIFKHNKYEG